jgi:hypothetical protein
MNTLIATIATDLFDVAIETPLTDEQLLEAANQPVSIAAVLSDIAAALGIEVPAIVQIALGDG